MQKTVKAANQVCRHKLHLGGGCPQTLNNLLSLDMQDPDILQKFPVFASYSKGDFTSSVSFKHAAQLSEEQKSTIYDIFEANMKDIYSKDSQKWNPKEKRRELFDVRGLSAPLTQQPDTESIVCVLGGSVLPAAAHNSCDARVVPCRTTRATSWSQTRRGSWSPSRTSGAYVCRQTQDCLPGCVRQQWPPAAYPAVSAVLPSRVAAARPELL